MSNATAFAILVVPVRFSVPVFVSESVPVPKIVLLIVRVPGSLNWSVPLTVTLPETVASKFKMTVSEGAIVPPT